MKRSKSTETISQEEFNSAIVKNFHLSMKDTLKGTQSELQRIYKKSCLFYVGCEDSNSDVSAMEGILGGYGDVHDIKDLLVSLIKSNNDFKRLFDEAYLSYILYLDPNESKHPDAIRCIQDAHIKFAELNGIDCSKFRYSHKNDKKYLHQMGMKVKPADVELHISELEEELNRMKKMRDPISIILMLKAEIKRLNRAGDIDHARDKEKEMNGLIEQMEAKNIAEKKDAERKAKQAIMCAKMREAKAKKKEQRLQSEKDRQKGLQQFNPHAAAKAKMKKIRERQAERNASKKKASENREWTNRPISQVIASRIL